MKKLSVLLLSVCFVAPVMSFANPASDVKLNDVRQAIEAAQKDLREKEKAQKETQAKLEQTRMALEKIQRELEELNRQQQDAWNKLQDLQARLTQLQTEIAGTKAQVSRLLIANYKNRRPNAVVLFLKNADPNQKSRFLNYTRYINESNDRVLKLLAEQQQELGKQEAAINTELERLRTLTLAQQKKLRELGQNRSQAQTVSRQLNADINRQRENLAKLREDEQRLNSVIAGISARRGAEQKAQADNRSQEAKKRAEQAKNNSGLTQEDLAFNGENAATNNTNAANSLSKRQGRLPMPAQGKVKGTFGSARESGGTWRGLFIETAPTSVQSIAEGSVSYAANLPGYGNTVIVDHGSGYMSVYTGLSRIGVREGSQVSNGQNIGMSGKLPAGEEGVYFELRYRNQAMNPRSWVK
ncbi:murein hydrolase activator EnvC family protein [Neisseriaceae bacterium B1]